MKAKRLSEQDSRFAFGALSNDEVLSFRSHHNPRLHSRCSRIPRIPIHRNRTLRCIRCRHHCIHCRRPSSHFRLRNLMRSR